MMTETEGSSNLLLPEENQMICGMIRSAPKAFMPDIMSHNVTLRQTLWNSTLLKLFLLTENINVKC